jgi:hypothetical protein
MYQARPRTVRSGSKHIVKGAGSTTDTSSATTTSTATGCILVPTRRHVLELVMADEAVGHGGCTRCLSAVRVAQTRAVTLAVEPKGQRRRVHWGSGQRCAEG